MPIKSPPPGELPEATTSREVSVHHAYNMAVRYAEESGTDEDTSETILAYLIADLAHLADLEQVDFAEVIERAQYYYRRDFEMEDDTVKGEPKW
jgi:hypothetical protein